MAQTQERKSDAAAAPTSGERKSLLSRFALPRSDKADTSKGSSRSAAPARQQSRMGKLMFGWLILLLVVEFSSTALEYISAKFPQLGLLKPWFHTNTFLIGGIDGYFAITLLVIVAAYYLLVRFNLIPRDLFGNTRADARASASTAVSQPGKPSPDGMGKARRTRAARRHTGSAVTTNPHPSPRRTATNTRAATPSPVGKTPTGHDEEYYQVKEAQRQLRRREAKR